MTNEPVIIAGAGPCGLLTAIVLKQYSIPFIIIERAANKSKLCSNVGSGYDLAPTAIEILRNRLNLGEQVSKAFHKYYGMYMCDMNGKPVRIAKMKDFGEDYEALSANRADMQNMFLDRLLEELTAEEEAKILRFGVEVVGYTEEEEHVKANLSDGSSVVGCAILGCDGIHSKVRRSMMQGVDDSLNFCHVTIWWGKTVISPGSELERAINETQTYTGEAGNGGGGPSFIWVFGDSNQPGSFMGGAAGGTLIWAYGQKSSEPPSRSDDLTRRGGSKLDDNAMKELQDSVSGYGNEILQLVLRDTPPSAITAAGLFDRTNLSLPYARGRVALLGDAAHPQSPYMGQGVNMAITDGYVCGTIIAHHMRVKEEDRNKSAGGGESWVINALRSYDSDERRQGVNSIVKKARSYGDVCVSDGWFTTWAFSLAMKFGPLSWMLSDMAEADRPNKEFLQKLDLDLDRAE